LFHLSPVTLLVLAVLALFIFGPDRLPKAVAEAVRTLRKVRAAVRGATDGFREDLGPEFKDLRLRDLHPRTLIQRHLLDDEPEPLAARAVPPPPPRRAPEGWPAHVPFPSAQEMGLGPDEDLLTAPIPVPGPVVLDPEPEPERMRETRPEGVAGAALAQTHEPRRDAAGAEPDGVPAHGKVGRD
jgi:sec-independent protein translocase protein TatB